MITQSSDDQAVLCAETVKFFLAAARHFKAFLGFQLFSLHADPFLLSAFDRNALRSSSLFADFSTVRHLAAWLETAFMTLDGDNRDNLRFMKHFSDALRREDEDPPIQLRREKYRDILDDSMAGMLKPVCNFYIEHLQLQRDKLAAGEKVPIQDLEMVDTMIARFSELLASDKFANVESYSFSILG